MKKAAIIVVLAVVVFAGAGWFFLSWRTTREVTVEKTIIFLKDGSEIVADETMGEGSFLFYYVVDGVTHSLQKSLVLGTRITYVKEIPDQEPAFIADLKQWTRRVKVDGVINEEARARLSTFRMRYGSQVQTILIYGGAVVFLLFLLIAAGRMLFGKKTKESEVREERKAVTAIGDFVSPESEQVVQYFLRLFQKNLRDADADAQTKIRPIPGTVAKRPGERTYELKVRVQNEWKSRRMTIAPLGESGGSKSKCFYVEFDERLVVKIPPESIADFDTYYQNVRADREIARTLSPRQCIVPHVSVVMKLLSPLENMSHRNIDSIEAQYVNALKDDPDLQDYLKIGGRFVFFMDMSQFLFLGSIVEEMHDVAPRIAREITDNATILWDEAAFESRYGAAFAYLCRDLMGLYAEFQVGVKQVQTGDNRIFEEFQIRKWFLRLLSGGHLAGTEPCADGIHRVFSDLAMKHNDVLKEHRDMVKTYVGEKAFRQQKPWMESICSNLLELLAWMGEKGVAMRDLKPDNLLVTGDRARYPAFLLSTNEYKIGLIDMETAVDFKPPQGSGVKQPPLGGTYYYATPSHFFTNEMIETIFGDLAGILHLQDWHATIGMVYKVVLGDYLFEKTGKRMSVVAATMQSAFEGNEELTAAAEITSRLFWESASEEFQIKIESGGQILNAVHVRIPENFRSVFIRLLTRQQEKLIANIRSLIEEQPDIRSDKLRNALLRASSRQLNREKEKWMSPDPDGGREHRNELPLFLDTVVELKHTAEKLSLCVNAIQARDPVMTADQLLDHMYLAVHTAMSVIPYGLNRVSTTE